MDFLESLRKKLECIIKCTPIGKGVYLLKLEASDRFILYYEGGTERVLSVEGEKSKGIHIDEDLWKTRPKALLNRIATLYGKAERSYARQTVVARIDKKTAMEFQEEHHLQGAVAGKYRYGLFKEGELLAVAVFSGLRKMRHTENYRSIELIHFCQKNQHLVVGGLSKLLTAMVNDFSPNDVMTYVDGDWSEGNKFESLGFKIMEITKPQHFKVDKTTFRREIIKQDEPFEFASSKNNYLVKNLGSIKMVKTIS
jgi:hypothetical protein